MDAEQPLVLRPHYVNAPLFLKSIVSFVEVERCARVLDGIVTVLDGSSGVQAQTLTVWRQAAKFRLPCSFFVNKLDKKEADFKRAVDSVEQKLGIKTLVTASPYFEKQALGGVVDVIAKRFVPLEVDGQWKTVEQNSIPGDILCAGREILCCNLAELNADFMSLFLEHYNGDAMNVPSSAIVKALRHITLSNLGAAIGCGSALRCPATVQPVLDHVIQLLPSPKERNTSLTRFFGDTLSGLVFKIGHDKRHGKLSFVRVYTGTLTSNSVLFNSSRGTSEGPVKASPFNVKARFQQSAEYSLFIAHSSELIPVSSVSEGNIAVVSGLSSAMTGDTLLASESVGHQAAHSRHDLKNNEKVKHDVHRRSAHNVASRETDSDDVGVEVLGDGQNIVLKGIDSPDPVYFCSIEPPTTKFTHEFEKALKEIAVEDPSLRIRFDQETGQTVVETMGELHLDIVKNRLIRDYGLNVFVGPLQIAYREIINDSVTQTSTVQDVIDEKKRNHAANLTLFIEPVPKSGRFKGVQVELPPDSANVRSEWLKAINEGCRNALHNGPVLGFPMQDVVIKLRGITTSGGRVNPAVLSACAHKCVTEAVEAAGARLIEPIMQLDITLESGTEAQSILHELTRRRADILDCSGTHWGATNISARLPLSEMSGFPTTLRTLSSGLGTLHVQLADYRVVSDHDHMNIVNRLKGIK
ncbi:putative translation elongation factor G [Ancylostoma caninum]|uniref:Putative translation elongation factor G n=1 Tax=Ancylostoma caninum TaxID=29170 RepID=A0A368H011_ANCCA|nr:putative translation elongation factor G [Ancylostoma caninum]